ncbi:Uncharacterised protein [Mycobacteroides abscessus subsp. abscessus]|nr:Uncharacterised protein [Mycobacteroides abscessus subsp. abscessus]
MLATAVPLVITIGTGCLDDTANPNAKNPADRSSIRTCSRSRPSRSARYSA